MQVVPGDHTLGYDGLRVDEDEQGESTLHVRVGMVMTEQHIAYLAALLAPFAPAVVRAVSKVAQAL